MAVKSRKLSKLERYRKRFFDIDTRIKYLQGRTQKLQVRKREVSNLITDYMKRHNLVRLGGAPEGKNILLVQPTRLEWDMEKIDEFIDSLSGKKLKAHGFASKKELREYVFVYSRSINDNSLNTLIQDKMITTEEAREMMNVIQISSYLRKTK